MMGGEAQPQFFLFLNFITVDVVLLCLKCANYQNKKNYRVTLEFC